MVHAISLFASCPLVCWYLGAVSDSGRTPGRMKTSLGGIRRAVQDALSVAVFAIPGGHSSWWV